MNKADPAGEQDQGRPGRIIVRDPSPAGDEVLDAALRIITAHQGKKPSTVIRPPGKNLRRTLDERLALNGVIRCGQARIPGVFPTPSWPAQDASHAAQVRRLVTQALVQQTAPHAGTAALIACCTRSGTSTRSSTPVSADCRDSTCERVLRRSPPATGHRKRFARQSGR